MPNRWILPDGIADALPCMANKIENLRRQILDLFKSYGYLQVITPHIEFVESLLTDAKKDLDLYTFKVADPISGKMLGFRADITPQVARIDAHNLKSSSVNRLCYIGSIIHTKARGLTTTRCPIQVGAELYGDDTLHADLEIICLMLNTLDSLHIKNIHLELAHIGIFQDLISKVQISQPLKQEIFKALQHKDFSALTELTTSLPNYVNHNIKVLTYLCGDIDVLEQAKLEFKNPPQQVTAHLAKLSHIAACLQNRYPNLPLHFDLAESRGFHYHTGLLFAAFVPQLGQALAQGGRYDGIGAAFGTDRPATGFSADLKTLVTLIDDPLKQKNNKIWASFTEDITLWNEICKLRLQGECVIQAHCKNEAKIAGCTHKLIFTANKWQVMPLL